MLYCESDRKWLEPNIKAKNSIEFEVTVLRGCPRKNRPLEFRPNTEFLQIFLWDNWSILLGKIVFICLVVLFYKMFGDDMRGRSKTKKFLSVLLNALKITHFLK